MTPRLRSALAVSVAAVCVSLLMTAGATGQADPGTDRPLGPALELDGPPPTVKGSGCRASEPGQAASPVDVQVVRRYEGQGRVSPDESVASTLITPAADGSWSYAVPGGPLSVVPTWATTLVLHAEATCLEQIGPGFDYVPAEFRRALEPRPAPASTTQPQATPPATAAPPISGTAGFTG